MQIVIDMPDLTYESIMKSKVLKDVGADFIRNGKPLPNNATNGDVIKAICPMWIEYHDTDIEVTINKKVWNAPYNPHKVGDTE